MHGGDLSLGGPVFAFAVFVFVLTAALAAFVVFDSLRARRQAQFARLPEPQWLYTALQAAYLVIFVLALFPVVTKAVGLPLTIATPFAFAEQIAYLLRVVFPRDGGPERAAEARRERGVSAGEEGRDAVRDDESTF